jgi:hypothetical protein
MDVQDIFGKIGSCDIIMKRPTDKFYFAFVTFTEKQHGKKILDFIFVIATRAAEEFRYITIKGCPCRVSPYDSSLSKVKSRNDLLNGDYSCYIFVGGFSELKWIH